MSRRHRHSFLQGGIDLYFTTPRQYLLLYWWGWGIDNLEPTTSANGWSCGTGGASWNGSWSTNTNNFTLQSGSNQVYAIASKKSMSGKYLYIAQKSSSSNPLRVSDNEGKTINFSNLSTMTNVQQVDATLSRVESPTSVTNKHSLIWSYACTGTVYALLYD